jgi:hypothetical protein
MFQNKNFKLLVAVVILSLCVAYFYLSQHKKNVLQKILSFMSHHKESLIMATFALLLVIYFNYQKINENFMDFEYNILNSADIKDTVTQIEIDAVNDLNQISVQKTIEINQEYPATQNVNLNGRLRSMIPLVKSKLLSVPSMMSTVAASYGYQSSVIQNDVSTIKQLLTENYRTHFSKIAIDVFDKSLALLIPNSPSKNDDLVDTSTSGLDELKASVEIQNIINTKETEYKDQFNKVYFKNLLDTVKESKYVSPDEITIYDAIPGITPTPELIKHYEVMSNFVNQIFDKQDIKFDLNNFGRFNEIQEAVKTYNSDIDNSPGKTHQLKPLTAPNLDNIDYNNTTIFSTFLSPLFTDIQNLIKNIPVNSNTQQKIVHLTKLSDRLKNTITDYDNMLNYSTFKEQPIELMNNESFQKYVVFLFFNEDNTINFKNVAIRLFMKPYEYANALKRLEELKQKALNRSGDAKNTKLDAKTGVINKELNLPVGYFKIGLKLPTDKEPLFLTTTGKYKSSPLEHLNQYRLEMRGITADNDLNQLFYCDIDGRIYNVDKKLCLTIIPSSGDPKNLAENDTLILSFPDEVSKPTQTFKFSTNFDRISVIKPENVTKDYYYTYNNASGANEVVLGEFMDDARQNKWFTKLIGEYKDQRSIFGSTTTDLTRNARQPLDVSVGTIPPYNTYTYSFWMQVNNENMDSTTNSLPNAVFIKGNIDNDNSTEVDKSTINYYRSPGVFLKYSADKTNYNLIFRLSSDKNLNEEFILSKPTVLKTTNDQTVWDHVEMVVSPKQLKVYLNGNEEYNVNTVGTVIPNPYSLKITPGGGFGGKLHFMRYYNYARSPSEVRKDMFETAPVELLFGNIPMREIITDDKFNTPTDYDHYGPNSARLHSSYGWFPKISNFYDMNSLAGTFYIQVNFDNSPNDPQNNYYKVEKMHIQGHGEKDAFIKKFKLSYYNHNDGDWKYFRNEELLNGTNSSLEFNTINNLDFTTNKVRIYPVEWHIDETNTTDKHRLGIRMGFYGKSTKPSKCDRMVSICSIDRMREADKADRMDVGGRLSTAAARLSISENKTKKLEEQIEQLQHELNKSRIENNLCPVNKPEKKCLPNSLTLLNPDTCASKNYTESTPAQAPKTNLQDAINTNIDMRDYQLKPTVKYGALCDHLMRVAPDRYENQNQCIEKLKKRIKDNK